jgi:outer membrane protein
MRNLVRILAIVVTISSAAVLAAPQAAGPAPGVVTITREQAEQLAMKNNPQISASRLLALAEGQTVREARSADLPQIGVNATAVKAEDGSRIGAGQLTSSRLYTHAGGGGTLSQLITDFGYTHDLIATANLRTKAQEQSARATEQDIIYATDQAFYRLMDAQSLRQLADQTVKARSNVSDQITALTQSKLKSDLDLNIASADVSQARLFALDAANAVETASAALAALLAAPPETEYAAVEDSAQALPPPPDTSQPLEAAALVQRPDLAALRYNTQASQQFAKAEARQYLPTISASAIGGVTPVRVDGAYPENWYAAAGVNLSLPIFTGFRISAQTKEARYRAAAEQAKAANLSNIVQRDVRTATLAAQTAFQRIAVAQQFKSQAAQALSLAQTRYQLGLSSIVELSQAQLQSTQADVSAVNALYDYLLALRSLDYSRGDISP